MNKSFAREFQDFENNLSSNNIEDPYGTFKEIYKKIDEIYNNLLNNHSNKTENCITENDDYFINSLKNAIKISKRIDIIVSFLMESGVRLLCQDLCRAAKRGADIRILTGSYLNVTQPSALYLLKDCLQDKLNLRMYSIENKSFHPKAYLFEYENGGDIFIGSSNISKSALTNGIE